MSKRRSSNLVVVLPLLAGCGAMLGIDDAHVDPTFDPATQGAGGAGTGGTTAGSGGTTSEGGMAGTSSAGGSDTTGGAGGTSSTGGTSGTGGTSTAGSGGAGGGATCGTHTECVTGDALGESCSACTMTVCSTFPSCCQGAWGDLCVQQAKSKCGSCGVGGAGGSGQGGMGQGGIGPGPGGGPGAGGSGQGGTTSTNCVGPGGVLDKPVAPNQVVVHVVNCGTKMGSNAVLHVHATVSGGMMPSAMVDIPAPTLPTDVTLTLGAGTYTIDATWDFPPAQQMGSPPGNEDAAGGIMSVAVTPVKGTYLELNLH
jgi:hypothetical protein